MAEEEEEEEEDTEADKVHDKKSPAASTRDYVVPNTK